MHVESNAYGRATDRHLNGRQFCFKQVDISGELAMAVSHVVVLFCTTAGQNAENLGSDEEQIVSFVYLLYDITNNKVSQTFNTVYYRMCKMKVEPRIPLEIEHKDDIQYSTVG